MIVRQEVLDTYWYFAAERQEIFFKRLTKTPRPWTDDPILDHYKFCNTYRASDRVSQYLIRNVIYKGSQNEEEVIFRILLFKIFNKIETWQHLEQRFGDITLKDFDLERFANALKDRINEGYPIYTSAYMSCATKAFGFDYKYLNHLALIRQMTKKDNIAKDIILSKSLEEVFSILMTYPLIGNFMAYQLSIDLNYSSVINFSENSFTIPGPGAIRGIRKCFSSIGNKSYEEVIHWMVENQEKEFERLGIKFQSLFGRSLHAIDCQGLFCETDKYSRAKFPELKSNRVRIKSPFSPTPRRIDYFYPPKWGINCDEAAMSETQEEQIPLSKTPAQLRQLSFLES